MEEKTFQVTGMHCTSCVEIITEDVSELEGVENVVVDLGDGTARVSFDPDRVSDQEIIDSIRNAGYDASSG